MASIDFLWKQYLSSEGYSSLRDALLDQTGLTNGQVDFLWYKYLQGEGYSGSLPAMMYNWLRDKGYSGSLSYMMYRALEDGNVFGGDAPPIGCSITLTNDIAALVPEYSPANASGQTFSVDDVGPGVYIASTDFVNRRPMPAPGKKVWIQCDGFSSTNAGVWAGFYLFDASGNPIGIVRATAARLELFEGVFVYGVFGLGIYDVNNPSNSPNSILWEIREPGPLPQYLSIAVDSEGEVFFYDQQAGEVVAASSIEPGWAGFFENAKSMCLVGAVQDFGSGPVSGTGHFTTFADDMLDVDYLGGDVDWCGNEIPAPPAPDPGDPGDGDGGGDDPGPGDDPDPGEDPGPYAWATLTTSSPDTTIGGRIWSLSTSGYKYSSVEFAGPPPAFSGRRAFEIQPLVGAFPDTLSNVGLILIRSGGTVSMRVSSSYGEYTVWGSVGASGAKFEIPYVPGTSGALVVDGDTGDVEFWWDGVLRYTESGFFGTNWISAVVSEGAIGDFQTGTVGAKIPLYPAQYAGTYDGASALTGESLG